MTSDGSESSSIPRREQNEPYVLATDMIEEAFSDDEVSQEMAHQWFNNYYDTVVGQEVHFTNEQLRRALLNALTLDELLSASDVFAWFKTSLMTRPIGLPYVQFAKIEIGFILTDEQMSELERLRSYFEFVVDDKAYRQQLTALYQEVQFSLDYEFFSAHEAYEQLPLDNIGEQYYDFMSSYCLKSSQVDDGDFCERDLLAKPKQLTADEYVLSEEDMLEVIDEVTSALTMALHGGVVAEALVVAERHEPPHLLESVVYLGENVYKFIDAAG